MPLMWLLQHNTQEEDWGEESGWDDDWDDSNWGDTEEPTRVLPSSAEEKRINDRFNKNRS